MISKANSNNNSQSSYWKLASLITILPITPSTNLVSDHPYWATTHLYRAQLPVLATSFSSDLSPHLYPTWSDDLTYGWNVSIFQWSCSRTSPLTIPMDYHVVFWIPMDWLPKGNHPWTQSHCYWGLEQQKSIK